MAHMTRSAPPGFKAPDISSVLRADKELWMKAFEECKSNIRVDNNGHYPLDAALNRLYTCPEVVFHLLPTPGAGSSTKRARSPDEAEGPVKPAPKKTPKPAPKPKNKQGKDRVKVPEALKGYKGMNKDNLRVCYNYNLPHGCSNSTHEKDGHLRCVKGCHECIKCGGKHSMQSCPKK